MSAISAATSDESTTKIVSSSTATSSYANIVQKDNGNNDKEKSNVKSVSAGETAKKSGPTNSAATTNVPSSNTNNKTDKSKVNYLSVDCIAQAMHWNIRHTNYHCHSLKLIFVFRHSHRNQSHKNQTPIIMLREWQMIQTRMTVWLMLKTKHHLHRLYHIVERIGIVAATRNVVNQMQMQPAEIIRIVRVSQAINHNDSHDRKMVAVKKQHINAQKGITIVMTKTSQRPIRNQLQQQVHSSRNFWIKWWIRADLLVATEWNSIAIVGTVINTFKIPEIGSAVFWLRCKPQISMLCFMVARKSNRNVELFHNLLNECFFLRSFYYIDNELSSRNRSGDNNTSNKASSSSTDHANTSSEESNAPASAGNTTTNSSEGAVKFVEAPLPKVNAWKVS